MDDLEFRLARIGLKVASVHGFVLGGGHAVQLHGMGARPSEDIDLFSPRRGTPAEAEADLVAAYRAEGLTVKVTRRTSDLVQMVVSDSDGHSCKVDLGVFWQARSPVLMEIGPVLHPDDAVAGKMDALFNRWAPRDFLDVEAILSSGKYTRTDLLSIAIEHNPGFDRRLFAESLSYLRDIPARDFTPYGVDSSHIIAMREHFADWEQELLAGLDSS